MTYWDVLFCINIGQASELVYMIDLSIMVILLAHAEMISQYFFSLANKARNNFKKTHFDWIQSLVLGRYVNWNEF